MPAIKVREGEPFEKAFRRFTKQCEKAGLMSDIKKHRKLNAAKRKMRKIQQMME